MTDHPTTFNGMPIKGDIIYGEKQKTQRPDVEFHQKLQAVLNDPTIVFVGWRQYTPYFNDGDACTFGIYDIFVNVRDAHGKPFQRVEDSNDPTYGGEEDYDDSELDFPPYGELRDIIGYKDYRDDYKYHGPDRDRYNRLEALNKAVAGGQHYALLLKTFGDHAKVTVTPGRDIEVEFYNHD